MGNYERTYGNDKFVTKLNAKELVLKKINADTNWVDIYTISLMLGESLNEVGNLMLDDDITELVNDFTTSMFSDEQNYDKVRYVADKAYTSEGKKKEKYLQLLDKVISADEVRILGKILKINQGLPTNTSDLYSYVKSIEKYIESRFNRQILEEQEEYLRIEKELEKTWLTPEKKEILKEERRLQKIYPELEEGSPLYNFYNKYNLIYEDINGNIRHGDLEAKLGKPKEAIKARQDYFKSRREMANIWQSFDLVRFITDPIYKQESIEKYEQNKVNFNILEVISTVPHFREMFNVLAINKSVLNSLSSRNRLEDIILNQLSRNFAGIRMDVSKPLNKLEIRAIKDQIDKYLIRSWIISKGIEINVPASPKNPAPYMLRLDNENNINKFRSYVENYAIPLLKDKLKDNKFVQLLTFGLRQGVPFYKLPLNMVQVDNTQKTRALYEEALYAFNNLNKIKVSGIDMNLVDMFYLYNLIVNQDKFGPNSMTRIFEDLVSSGNEDLLIYDFNSWIDSQNIEDLVNKFRTEENSIRFNLVESTPIVDDIDSDIGFKEAPLEEDIEEAQYEELVDNQDSNEKQLVAWARTSDNSYEVSTKGDSRFSALNATFKEGTIIDGVDVSGMTIEDVYQKVIKKSSKGKAPARGSIVDLYEKDPEGLPVWLAWKHKFPNDFWNKLYNTKVTELTKEDMEDFSYYVGYLPLWQEWARQNSELMDELRIKSYSKTLTDKFATTRVSQARALADILNKETNNTDNNYYYQTNPSTKSKLITIIKEANLRGLHIVTDSDLVNEDSTTRNARGFVKNGEIYINVDRAEDDTVVHEFSHLYLADAKVNSPNEYYSVLSRVRNTGTWKYMREMPEYQNKRGSDFDEEVLATLIERAYNEGLGGVDYDVVIDALNLVSPEFKSFIKSDILPSLGETLIENYKVSQKIATLKNKLIKDNIIKEDCK